MLAIWIVNYVVDNRIDIYTVFLGIARLKLKKFEQIRVAILALWIVSLLLQVLVLFLQLEFWLVSSLFGLREWCCASFGRATIFQDHMIVVLALIYCFDPAFTTISSILHYLIILGSFSLILQVTAPIWDGVFLDLYRFRIGLLFVDLGQLRTLILNHAVVRVTGVTRNGELRIYVFLDRIDEGFWRVLLLGIINFFRHALVRLLSRGLSRCFVDFLTLVSGCL